MYAVFVSLSIFFCRKWPVSVLLYAIFARFFEIKCLEAQNSQLLVLKPICFQMKNKQSIAVLSIMEIPTPSRGCWSLCSICSELIEVRGVAGMGLSQRVLAY